MLYDWAGNPIGETPRIALASPEQIFGGTYRHPCLNGCGNEMVVPDRQTPGAPELLCEGDIWACLRCGAAHEYYLYYADGARHGACRLLAGNGDRASGEPRIDDFIP